MPFKLFLTAVIAAGAAYFAAALWTPASAMGPLSPSATTSAAKSTLIEEVRHRRWRRGYAYYPRHRWYGYRYRPYYYSYYGAPYYARPYYDYPYYYRPRVYGYGFYRPRFGLRIGF